MKIIFWFISILLLLVLGYFGGTGMLIRHKQTDILLIVSIFACTLSFWGMWYSFLKKFYALVLFLGAILAYSLWLVYTAMLVVFNPTFM